MTLLRTRLMVVAAAVLDGVAATDGDEISLGGGEQTDQAWVEELVGPVDGCRSEPRMAV